jgi:hypothetical protein
MILSWVGSRLYPKILDQAGNWLAGKNTLAYAASFSKVRKEKSFITSTPRLNVVKLFTFVINKCNKKAKAFLPMCPF